MSTNDAHLKADETPPTNIIVPTVHIQRRWPPSGLTNNGGSCFVNASLQMLFHIPLMRWAILNYSRSIVAARNFSDHLLKRPAEQDPTLLDDTLLLLQHLFEEMQEGKQSVNTDGFVYYPHWESFPLYEQNDTQLFLSMLLARMKELFKATPFRGCCERLLGGKAVSILKLAGSETVVDESLTRYTQSVQYMPYYVINLPIGDDVSDIHTSLQRYCAPTPIEDDGLNHSDGSPYIISWKQTCFLSFPPVLFFQIQRWRFNPTTYVFEKNTSFFSYPLELDMTPYLTTLTPQQKAMADERRKILHFEKEERLMRSFGRVRQSVDWKTQRFRPPLCDEMVEKFFLAMDSAWDEKMERESEGVGAAKSVLEEAEIKSEQYDGLFEGKRKEENEEGKRKNSMFIAFSPDDVPSPSQSSSHQESDNSTHSLSFERPHTSSTCPSSSSSSFSPSSSSSSSSSEMKNSSSSSSSSSSPSSSSSSSAANSKYSLLGVAVHKGSLDSGHYYSFIRPDCADRWFVLDDTSCVQVTEEHAVSANFGGPDPRGETGTDDRQYSAYMLVYVAKHLIPKVMLWGE
ncbi:putative Ubiquitin carboxyl-terminal hydrolase [Monocercomonoides exilis]|uniref:putative Ubiquitin carboxyl-terminal hydrolase n=1 Tax=Monocercomonoides exilis TaxID=2049356 RepID=UPI003559CB2D|nr:putative Ubiquitin carboxyl-terminal hydrolase [Monocercomonoides exilis]|eukprot:MONOS_11366.1-p1 / transcript=MONOS_11366.1 / gene=MONOS_11366 / organism=Monocercomonoides_exilis_PA203 / gene_product=unspecified product / transcript_product=unspecified product / location=Mono_scaffold00566:32869-35204(-) / protein_length=570 / sequence_SO=supercontig / SO=protein_coding / is_pseudo=false